MVRNVSETYNWIQIFEEAVTTQRYPNNILTVFVQELQDEEFQDGFFNMTVPQHIQQ